MVYGSIVGVLDRLSVKTVLTNHTGSYIGFLGTIGFLAVCIALLVPPINLYNIGSYFQSQFGTQKPPDNKYYSGKDFILAVSFRNKNTSEYANHTEILSNIVAKGYYQSPENYFMKGLQACNKTAFKVDAINPLDVTDCIMLPQDLIYDITVVQGYLPLVRLAFIMKCTDPFKCNDNNPEKAAIAKFIVDLQTNYYYEYIFTSKIVDDQGKLKFQFHKAYSTEYDSPDGFSTVMFVQTGQKATYLDNSIMPWWNNMSYTYLYWDGVTNGRDITKDSLTTAGFYIDYQTFIGFRYSYRYYKKLDFLLGMIGGTIFLLFLIFWLPCSYINRTLQKMKNAQDLLISADSRITTDQNLKRIEIPFTYIITKWLPGNRYNHIIETSEHQIDLIKIIKKLKVTQRNLKTNKVEVVFKSKDINLETQRPEEFNPDRQALNHLDMNINVYQALKNARNTQQIYECNSVVLAIKQSDRIDPIMVDQMYDKIRRPSKNSCLQKLKYYISEAIKFFDIFGAKPMLNADNQASSCWGFFLTIVIIALAILTFALTIQNMSSIQFITSYTYESPIAHNYQMTTSKNFHLAMCFNAYSASYYLSGSGKSVKLSFFKQSKKNGYQELAYEKMGTGQFIDYFSLPADDPNGQVSSQNCFRPSDNQIVPMGGSYETINEAYFGIRLDPYCSGTPSQCALRKNQTLAAFLSFVNDSNFGIYLNENKFDPTAQKIITGISAFGLSQTYYMINGNLSRTQTVYTEAIQLLDDTSKSFVRQNPKVIDKTMTFESYGYAGAQRKGDPTVDPAYIFQLKPSGQVKSIIFRSYKIDFLFGIIGGCFLFWYFVVNIFAKFYNAYKIRAKLAEVLHQQDGYDQSILVHFLYLSKIPSSIFCCSSLQADIRRVNEVDNKIKRDTDYLTLVKQVSNCHKLSSSLFPNIVEKDLSLIYFREKIDEGQLVKPKRISQQFIDQEDEFMDFDDQMFDNKDKKQHGNQTMNLIPQNSNMNSNEFQVQKIIGRGQSRQQQPLYDHCVPWKEQSLFSKVIKHFDIFKNPPELTLDGQRDVKSIIGGIFFFILLALILLVVSHFLNIYTTGTDYTISYNRFVDIDLNKIDLSNTFGDLSQGINLKTGSNFKFAVTFNTQQNYYPFNVSSSIGPIGIRMLQYTITRVNKTYVTSVQSIELQSCKDNYTKGFMGPYNNPNIYNNLTFGYCVPDGKTLTIKGTPQSTQRQYFKLNIYNKYGNSTGTSALNTFFATYIVTYYMSVPRHDLLAKTFYYDMTQINDIPDPYALAIETNLTFSKMVFTDKYYRNSRQSYNGQRNPDNQRSDYNALVNESSRNLTFYYNGMIDHYTLDYPQGGQLFGLVGGVIAMFTFIIYNCINSYNQYRMKYLIGQRLYTFDKKLSGLTKMQVKKLNKQKLEEMTKQVNNMNQLQLLLAWMLSPIGFIRDNYNFNKTLRRATLIIERVQKDISLYSFYKQLSAVKSALNKRIKLRYPSSEEEPSPINLTSVYTKQIYNPEPTQLSIPLVNKESKKHKFSPYEQFKINAAIQAKVNPHQVFGDKVFNRLFGIDDGMSSIGRNRVSQHGRMQQDSTNVRNSDSKNPNEESSVKINDPKMQESYMGSFQIQE